MTEPTMSLEEARATFAALVRYAEAFVPAERRVEFLAGLEAEFEVTAPRKSPRSLLAVAPTGESGEGQRDE